MSTTASDGSLTPEGRAFLLLPLRPPMRLVEEVLSIVPGKSVRTRRVAHSADWYFQGHFPDNPIVPAIILVELLAQSGGIAAASDDSAPAGGLRLAALGGFKFPAAAGPGAVLETTARVAGRVAGLIKIEGEVTADGRRVAIGSLTLSPAPGPNKPQHA